MDKRVLVTGGSKGIGLAIAKQLVEEGYQVDITYRSSAKSADDFATNVNGKHGDDVVRAFEVDLSDIDSTNAFCESLESNGAYWGVVYCAGMSSDGLAGRVDIEHAKSVMQTNFWSFISIVNSTLRPMVRAKQGRIVAMGSAAAIRGNKGNGIYAASKSALDSYMRTITAEYAAKGIQANCIAPGFVDTEMLQPYESQMDMLKSKIPSKDLVQVEEVSNLVSLLMNENMKSLMGSTFVVDGGMTATFE